MLQLDKDDILHDSKKWLLDRLGIPNPTKWHTLDISSCASAARVLCLRKSELQILHGVEGLQQPVNPRNEAAALALLVSNHQAVCRNMPDREQQLQELLEAYAATAEAAAAAATLTSNVYDDSAPEQHLNRYCSRGWPQNLLCMSVPPRSVLQKGATSQLLPALFSNSSSDAASCSSSSSSALRGCSAAVDIPPGSTVVSLPSQLLITYRSAAESDFGQVLSRLGLDPETLAVVWTMVDRWDDDSAHTPFWNALPQQFDTGLSVPEPLVDLLKGCPEHAEFKRARQHVREQFAQLQQVFKVLLTAYAAQLQPGWFTEANYLWVVELWYAYAIQVKFPDGAIQPALAPFVSLINHSPYPHIVHFSTVDPKTRHLNLSNFRTIKQGQQAYLSYGPLPNAQLLLFYGFSLGANPFEEAVITLQQLQHQQQQVEAVAQAAAAGELNTAADRLSLLQQLGLPQQYTLSVQQPLPPGLLPCLRVMCATADELQALQQAVQKHQQKGSPSGSSGVSAAAKQDSKAGGSKSASKIKGGDSKRSSKKVLAGTNTNKRSPGSSKNINDEADLQAAWEAAGLWQAVLSRPLSASNDAQVHQVLSQVLATAKVSYEGCLAKIAKRRQLQQLLQQKQEPGSRDAIGQEGFLAALEALCRDMVILYDACDAAASS